MSPARLLILSALKCGASFAKPNPPLQEARIMKYSLPLQGSLILLGLFCLSGPVSAGYYYESTTKERTEGTRGIKETTVKGWVDGDKSRIEFVTAEESGPISKGNYLISTDGGETVYLVNPKDKTYAPFSLKDMMAGLNEAMAMMKQMGGMMKIEFTDVSSEKLLEEPGEQILGRPTTHYRYKSRHTMNMNMMGMKQSSTSETIQDVWSTDTVDLTGFGIWLNPGRGAQTGNEEFDELLRQQMDQISGFPLKIVNESTVTDKRGRAQKGSFVTDVTVLREESVDDGVFEWPAGFTETQIIPDTPDMPDVEGMKGIPGFRK